MEKLTKKSIVLESGLAKEAEAAARGDMRSFSGYVAKLLADKLNYSPTPEGAKEEVAS